MARWKLLAGTYIDSHPTEKRLAPGETKKVKQPNGEEIEIGTRPADQVFRAGIQGMDIIETDKDLSRFNPPGYPPKFLKLEDGDANVAPAITYPQPTKPGAPPVGPKNANQPIPGLTPHQQPERKHPLKGKVDPPLEQMDEKALVEFANEEEIDLKGAKTKPEMVKTIRAAIK